MEQAFRCKRQSKAHASFSMQVNQGLAGRRRAAMPEKRQGISAECR